MDTAQWDAPVTVVPLPEEELTPPDACSPPDAEVEVLLDEVEVLDVDVLAVRVEDEDEDDVSPGMVAALTALKTPTAAAAASAATTVSRLSSRSAASLARTPF